MTVYAQVTFTAADGTSVTSVTPEIGAALVRLPGASNVGAPQVLGNKLVATENYVGENYYSPAVPATADYSVEIEWTYNGSTDLMLGPTIRSRNDLNQLYVFAYRKSDGGVRITGTPSGQLGSIISLAPTSGHTYLSRITTSGTTISGFLQRKSDDQWLTPSGTWQSGEVACSVQTDSNITAKHFGGFWLFESTGTRTGLDNFRVFDDLVAPATGTTLSGPSSGTVGTASTNFTVGVTPTGGDITGTVTVTPGDGGAGGTFSPTTVALTNGSPTGTFTYTPSTTGARTISITDNGGLTDAAGVTYTSNAAPATAVTMSGPSSGTTGAPSSNFSVGANGAITGTVIVTPSDGGGGGTFTPTTRSISAGTPTGTFTYTAASSGAKTISVTNNGGLTNPSTITYTASDAAATAVTLSGPTAGTVGVASSNFVVGANGVITGTVVVTPSDSAGGGTFSPSSVSISSGSPTATFTYTAGSAGSKSISTSDNGSLTDPTPISFTASAPLPYTRVDFTEPASAQDCTMLRSNSWTSGQAIDLVVFCHNQNQSHQAIDTEADVKAVSVALCSIAPQHIAVISSNARGSSWGSQASIDDVAQLVRHVGTTYFAGNIRSVVLWGVGMGAMVALNVAASGRLPRLDGIMLTAPACNLGSIHTAGTNAANINAAFGITGSGQFTYAIRTAGYDPMLRQAIAYRNAPMRMWASASDGTAPKTTNADALAAIVLGWCRESAVVTATGGHVDASHYQPSDAADFVSRCIVTRVASGRPATTKTVTTEVRDKDGTLVANATGIKWAWFDQPTPDASERPTDKGTGATTNASGIMTISVRSNLPTGGVGRLEFTNSDGTTTQSPARKGGGGPVQVGA